MTTTVALLVIPAGLFIAALTGPWVLRRSAPALVHIPRLAVFMLLSSILTWPLAVLAIGPLLAWASSGPVLLPGRAGEMCQQCLAAANPWAEPISALTGVPAIVLLAVPAIGGAVLIVASIRAGLRQSRATARAAAAVRRTARGAHLHGHRVLLIDDPTAQVFAFPARHGGIVLSRTAQQALSEDELRAVLAHEQAHLHQHHHLLLAIATAVGHQLRWVPYIAAATAALPHYLEIAADDAARRHAGTPALAGALLRLGEANPSALAAARATGALHVTGAPHVTGALPATAALPIDGALHATGPHRIGHLVSPGPARGGRWPALVIGTYLGALSVVSIAVGLPYLGAVVAGCG